MQRFLLGGRLPWSMLAPAAVVTAADVAGFSSLHLSRAMVWNAGAPARSGSFRADVLLTWFSLVLLGGSVVGHAVHQRRAAG
jgi:hypothetical protein